MKTIISLLRGINVGGRKVLMTDLKAIYEKEKLREVITYIQSGNVICKADESLGNEALAAKLEKALLKKYAFEIPVINRSAAEIKKVLGDNPFLREKGIDTERLYVTFLNKAPGKTELQAIRQFDFPPERFIISGLEVYLHCPTGYGEAKLSNSFFEKKLKVSATTRNWKTVNKLAEMAGA